MPRPVRVLAALLALLLGLPPALADGPLPTPAPAEYIAWVPTVGEALEIAKKDGKPVMIAINAERVDAKTRIEPAAKELRENTYRDASVVAKSRQFVCVLVKPDGSSGDYSELRARFAIDGAIVSPQHIFAHADGSLISREQYWKYGTGTASVEALLGLMDQALAAHKAKAAMGGSAGGDATGDRAKWIADRLQKVRGGAADHTSRDVAVQELVKGDQKGDCVTPLLALLPEIHKDVDSQVAIVRAVGKPGLEAAVLPLAHLLDDTSEDVRSNAAVSLEYVGSALAIDALTKRLPKEREELTFNNICRALGHCGSKDEAVRKTLLRELATAKNNRVTAGPAIGLAYFERDAEAARGIEKVLAASSDWQKRAFMMWALTEIRDPKSADFVKEKVQKNEKSNVTLPFIQAVVKVLSGTDDSGEARRAVEYGVGSAIGTVTDIGGSARKGRDAADFSPKGEIEPRGKRGGPPGGSGMGG